MVLVIVAVVLVTALLAVLEWRSWKRPAQRDFGEASKSASVSLPDHSGGWMG